MLLQERSSLALLLGFSEGPPFRLLPYVVTKLGGKLYYDYASPQSLLTELVYHQDVTKRF
jgi:hypothetical protein